MKNELAPLKDNIEINEDLNFSEFREKYINNLIKSYERVSNNDDNNKKILYNDLINPIF